MDLEASARAKKIADEDLNYFLNINRSFLDESAEFSLKNAQQSLEYSEEELKQLEKMYKADDLTEETEEIVLKRARNEVEQGKFYLKSHGAAHEEDAGTGHSAAGTAVDRSGQACAEIGLAKARATLPVSAREGSRSNATSS